MKIGVFDSGVGGLIITHSLIRHLPGYDYLYLGDTARVPYGNRSQAIVYQFTREAVEYLFAQDCQLIIIACNTASADALRGIQRDYLPQTFPGRRVLGVLVPTAEQVVAESRSGRIGVLATKSTVLSGTYVYEIQRLAPEAHVFQRAAPLLVPLIEHGGLKWASPIVDEYLAPLLSQSVDSIILGCTHYPALKELIREKVGPSVRVISQDEFIPQKLQDYLHRHPEIDSHLSRTAARQFHVTDLTDSAVALARDLFSEPIRLEAVSLLPG